MKVQLLRQTVVPTVLLISILLTFGCKSRTVSLGREAGNVSADDAARIAKREVVEHHGWTNFETVGVTYYSSDECWAVVLQRLPAVPCGHTLINVSARTGCIIRFYDN